MDHDSDDLGEAQLFCLDDAVFIVYTPEAEPPEADPPPRTYAEQATRLWKTMSPLVERVLRRCHVPEGDVLDLTQTVLLDVLQWWSTRCTEPDAKALQEARAYIAVVARHAAYRYHRQLHQSGERMESDDVLFFPLEEDDAPPIPLEPSPEEAVLAAEARAELASWVDLDALGAATSPSLWRAFYAYTVLNVPVEVIADTEGVVISTIYNRIRLAREDLRASVRRRRAAQRG